MIELKNSEIKFILKYFVICKDLKSLVINQETKKAYLNKKDHETLKTLKRLAKGY